MAAYAQTTGFKTSINRALEIWNNTQDRIVIEDLVDLIDTEYAAMETAGLAGYTVTTGLEATLLSKLSNFSNDHRRLILADVLSAFVTECGLVATNGLAYTVTTNFVNIVRRMLDNFPNSTHKIALYQIVDILFTEFDACEDAAP